VTVERLAPAGAPVEAPDLAEALRHAPALEPFADDAVACCGALSRTLFASTGARRRPELVALAHWLRPASVLALRQQFARLAEPGAARAARGLAFHVTPANVDTVAGYSLALSLLVGNRNVVRISPRAGAQAELLCRALDEVLLDHRFEAIRAGTALVRYGHDADANEAFSRACDLRIVWGGDDTVAALRRVPLAPGAKELAFPDRFSFAVASSDAYLEADDSERDALAERLYLDAYPFDQRACSSPRLLVWVGETHAAEAGDDLFARLAAVVAFRGYELPLGAVTGKLAFAFGAAADGRVRGVRRLGNELTVLRLADLDDFDRTHPGAGLFFEAKVPAVSYLAPFVTRKDQTVTAYGLPADELAALAAAGVDRVVPWGEALAFERHWDGFDLLGELTRAVPIRVAA
jgi:acyl-CoA reductase LuxC